MEGSIREARCRNGPTDALFMKEDLNRPTLHLGSYVFDSFMKYLEFFQQNALGRAAIL